MILQVCQVDVKSMNTIIIIIRFECVHRGYAMSQAEFPKKCRMLINVKFYGNDSSAVFDP